MPRNTTPSSVFCYTYVLESALDGNRYIGYTNNLNRRIAEHRRGSSFATKFRRPFNLVYYEACRSEADAKRREGYLKTTQGNRFLSLRLLEYKRSSALASGR